MFIFGRASLIIIVLSTPALAIGDPGYYHYPSYYPQHNYHKQDIPPDLNGPNNYLGGAKVNLLEYNPLATTTTPTQAGPTYAPPSYHPPTVPAIPTQLPPAVSPDQAYDLPVDTPAFSPPADSQDYQLLVDSLTYNPSEDNQDYAPPASTSAYKPPVESPLYNLPFVPQIPTETHLNTPTEETHADTSEYTPTYDKPTPPKWGHGKPSPMPNSMYRRSAPRVPRQKIGKGTTPGEGHTHHFPFLKKRQQARQHTVVTVNMITGIGYPPGTSSTLTTTTANALPPSPSPLIPGLKVDTSQAALSLPGNPVATTQSAEMLMPQVSPYTGSQQHAELDRGEPRNKTAVIASVLSIVVGLAVIIAIVKFTSNAMRKRKHAVGLEEYDEHLSSKEGLIPEMSDQAHFEAHDVIITRPDGSEISPLSSGGRDSPSPPPFRARVADFGPSPLPMPTFAPPPAPASPLSLPYVKLLSPSINLAQQNLVQSRSSATSETMSMSTTSTDISERQTASDGESLGRQVSHRRMRSAPGSVIWSARSSSATGKLTTGISGEEGYWESVDVCGSESVGRMGCRSSRGRSVAMSVMW